MERNTVLKNDGKKRMYGSNSNKEWHKIANVVES